MDLSTALGLIIGFATVAVVMVLDGGSPAELFSVPQAILLIFAGSLSATAISSPLKNFTKLPKLIGLAFGEKHYKSAEAIDMIAKMADKARREGLLALEEEAKKIKDQFLKKGIMLVVDGVDSSQVHAILETTIEQTAARHKANYSMFQAAGGFAPTFGIIGTVMGLISVLKALDDPGKLAESIAAAFLATLWGLLSANLIFLPLGNKLKAKDEEETEYRFLLMEGVLSLQAGENPRIVREKLSAYLAPGAEAKGKPGKAAAPTGERAKA
jgi:chemotaxis protein MotA